MILRNSIKEKILTSNREYFCVAKYWDSDNLLGMLFHHCVRPPPLAGNGRGWLALKGFMISEDVASRLQWDRGFHNTITFDDSGKVRAVFAFGFVTRFGAIVFRGVCSRRCILMHMNKSLKVWQNSSITGNVEWMHLRSRQRDIVNNTPIVSC